MLSPWRVYDIVQHLQHHLSIPVTVKCRIGVDGKLICFINNKKHSPIDKFIIVKLSNKSFSIIIVANK